MAGLNESLNALMGIDGAQAVALVDYESGMLLGEAGAGMDMEVAAAGNTEVIRAKMKTAASLNLNDSIEDILISLGKAYHIMRPVAKKKGLFFYNRAGPYQVQPGIGTAQGAGRGSRTGDLSQ